MWHVGDPSFRPDESVPVALHGSVALSMGVFHAIKLGQS